MNSPRFNTPPRLAILGSALAVAIGGPVVAEAGIQSPEKTPAPIAQMAETIAGLPGVEKQFGYMHTLIFNEDTKDGSHATIYMTSDRLKEDGKLDPSSVNEIDITLTEPNPTNKARIHLREGMTLHRLPNGKWEASDVVGVKNSPTNTLNYEIAVDGTWVQKFSSSVIDRKLVTTQLSTNRNRQLASKRFQALMGKAGNLITQISS